MVFFQNFKFDPILQLGTEGYNFIIYKKSFSQYKTVWRTLITSCYKELIDSLTN